MRNRDLIAFLRPLTSQFDRADALELTDLTGKVTDIDASHHRISLRLNLPRGLYRGLLRTAAHAFDMATAELKMIRVPDGKRVSVGPWDLDHQHNVMAMPMARTYVNGRLTGGLWFAMPGPLEIAEGRLFADFGFEAAEGPNEIAFELVERDRERLGWDRLESLELRSDDRRQVPLQPASNALPRILASRADLDTAAQRLTGTARFTALQERLRNEPLVMLTDNSQGSLSLACIVYSLSGDREIGQRARAAIMDLAHASTWSGRPDPLLMGGDNDRGISLRLFHIALAWDHLQPLLDEDDRRALLQKAEEYLRKMYDFTLLQRAYMGCPATDPHALGSWNGTAIACMAFYEELTIARHALPFFHGLFCDSLQLFPASGKAAWATYFPFHLVLYLAAAQTFAGRQPALSSSPFLDHLGDALLTCFDAPNSQELQRGLRTREHRFLTAYLCHFHPTPGIDAIYRAFVEREQSAAGDVSLGIFDLLYAPSPDGPVARIPDRPHFAKDTGDLIATARPGQTIAVSLAGGTKTGGEASFRLMPQNREFAPSLGALEVAIDGTPVLCNVNISGYGINSALTNAMCLEDGGGVTNGQYLNGAVAPEQRSVVRRCLLGDRFLYMHVVITGSLAPALEVERADRAVVFDRKTGTVLLSDAFAGRRALRFATHLHCSGSVSEVAADLYRMTGGQANLIAGIKGGNKGLDDKERGELFVQILSSSSSSRVSVEEPAWVPGYIYGLNLTGREELADGRFPRYQRLRLEAADRVTQGSFLVALSPQPEIARMEQESVLLPEGGASFGPGTRHALGVTCQCECLLWDEAGLQVMVLGADSLSHLGRHIIFPAPADIEYNVQTREGTAYASRQLAISSEHFQADQWTPVAEDAWKTHATLRARFKMRQTAEEKE
jgi:hypothetical protein